MSKHYRIIINLFFIMLMLMVSVLSDAVQAEEEPVTETINVIGTGFIGKEDSEKGKEAAIEDSLSSAVEQVALKILPLESFVNHFQEYHKILSGDTKDFIQSYKMVAGYESGEKYRAMVEVTVSVDRLKERLAEAEEIKDITKSLPKILFLISEQNIQDILPQYWWGETPVSAEFISEDAIANVMKEKGFVIIEHGVKISGEKESESAVIYKPYLESYEAVEIGIRFQADAVIVGRAMVQQSLNIMEENARTYTGIITVKAFRTDTGEEISSFNQTAVKTNTDENEGAKEALISVGNLAGEELASQISYTWQEQITSGDGILLAVSGTSHLGNFVMFRKALNELPGVKEIQIREMKANEATIHVDFEGTIQSLADALMKKTFESFGINIYERTGNQIKIDLVRN